MRPIVVTQTGPGVSAWIPLDQYIATADVGLYTKLTGGTTYSLEYTDEDPFASGGILTDGSANVFTMSAFNAISTKKDGGLSYPARAIRINNQGPGAVRLTVLQAGIGGT